MMVGDWSGPPTPGQLIVGVRHQPEGLERITGTVWLFTPVGLDI